MAEALKPAQFIRLHLIRQLITCVARSQWNLSRIDAPNDEASAFTSVGDTRQMNANRVWKFLQDYDCHTVRLTFHRHGLYTWVDLHPYSEPETIIAAWFDIPVSGDAKAHAAFKRFAEIVASIKLS